MTGLRVQDQSVVPSCISKRPARLSSSRNDLMLGSAPGIFFFHTVTLPLADLTSARGISLRPRTVPRNCLHRRAGPRRPVGAWAAASGDTRTGLHSTGVDPPTTTMHATMRWKRQPTNHPPHPQASSSSSAFSASRDGLARDHPPAQRNRPKHVGRRGILPYANRRERNRWRSTAAHRCRHMPIQWRRRPGPAVCRIVDVVVRGSRSTGMNWAAANMPTVFVHHRTCDHHGGTTLLMAWGQGQ